MVLPATTLLLAWSSTPYPVFPAIRFPAPVTDPPIVLPVAPDWTLTPFPPLATAAAPVGSVPM